MKLINSRNFPFLLRADQSRDLRGIIDIFDAQPPRWGSVRSRILLNLIFASYV